MCLHQNLTSYDKDAFKRTIGKPPLWHLYLSVNYLFRSCTSVYKTTSTGVAHTPQRKPPVWQAYLSVNRLFGT